MTKRINGHGPTFPVVVPQFAGVDAGDWTDLPPAAYPMPTIERVIAPRLQAGEDLIRLNGYRCDGCDGITLTYDRHPGIAPAFVDHARFDPNTRCPGVGHSLGYPADAPPTWEASHEWFRPSEDLLLTLGDAAIKHVLGGGLLLRPIPTATTPTQVEA